MRRHDLALEPAHRRAARGGRIGEAPGPAAVLAVATRGADGGIAVRNGGAGKIAPRPVITRLRIGRRQAGPCRGESKTAKPTMIARIIRRLACPGPPLTAATEKRPSGGNATRILANRRRAGPVENRRLGEQRRWTRAELPHSRSIMAATASPLCFADVGLTKHHDARRFDDVGDAYSCCCRRCGTASRSLNTTPAAIWRAGIEGYLVPSRSTTYGLFARRRLAARFLAGRAAASPGRRLDHRPDAADASFPCLSGRHCPRSRQCWRRRRRCPGSPVFC